MKTYLITSVFIACLTIGCTKEAVVDKNSDSKNLIADYTVLLKKDGVLQSANVEASTEGMTYTLYNSDSGGDLLPQFSYRDGLKIGFLNTKEDCSAEIKIHNFIDNSVKRIPVFTEDLNCDITVKALAFSEKRAYIAYEVPITAKKNTNYIRILDYSETPNSYEDVEIAKDPKQIIVSGERLFVLTLDKETASKYSLSILQNATGAMIHEAALGVDVLKIAKNQTGNILVSYPNLHSLFDNKTMIMGDVTNYLKGKEPGFGNVKSEFYGDQTLYYSKESGSKSIYPNIAAVYDFKKNNLILYLFENFLTVEERNFKYEIEDVTTVSYDVKNNLILIGYKKIGEQGKGGLLRIKPIPEPKFIDNINLDGVPYELFPE